MEVSSAKYSVEQIPAAGVLSYSGREEHGEAHVSVMPIWFSWWPTVMSHTPPWQGVTRAWHRHLRTGSHGTSTLIVVLTDPDGTLLDHRAHPCVPSYKAFRVLADHNIPLVLCSSRTRAELEIIQQEFRFRHPFISENGGAVYLPRGYFSPSSDSADVSGYDVIPFGGSHQHVVDTLRRTAEAQGIEVRGFNGMSVQEVANECGLTLAEARLAQLREFGEPFRILSSDPAVHSRLINALRRAGLRCVNGGGFHHVSSGADVRRSVQALRSLYRQRFGRVLTVGVSAGLTDPSLLGVVDIPIVVPDSEVDLARVLRKVPTARVTNATGSAGWDEAILLAVEPELTKTSRQS
jgi:mannosyl-3-phosphoglycerate phosphatase